MEYGAVFLASKFTVVTLVVIISAIIYIIFEDCLVFQTESNGDAAANGSAVASDKKID